jgi:hypothetical protein
VRPCLEPTVAPRRRAELRQTLLAGYEDDLELDPVGVVEEGCVVAGHVVVLLRLALDLGTVAAQPFCTLVDDVSRGRPERDVVDADRIAIEGGTRLPLTQTELDAVATEVVDGLTALADDRPARLPSERAKEVEVEGQASFERADDEVEVVKRARY